MGRLYNIARMTTATSGVGTITLGSAVSSFLSFAAAGVANAEVVGYAIEDGANREVGYGTYTTSGTTLTRNVTSSTNGGSAISLSGTAHVFLTMRASGGYPIFDGVYFGDALDTNLYRSAANVLKTDDQLHAAGAITTKTKAGAPTDSDTDLDADGSIIMDTTNSRLYVRSSGAWVYVPLAAADPGTVPAGAMHQYGGLTAPTGYLLCDGAAVSRSTYASLYSALVRTKGTITVTIATPGVVSLTSHGLQIGDAVFFSTSGALPTGITADTTTYYVISAGFGANSFQISTSRGGSAVNTSGSQSGTHTMWHAPYGVAASTTFNVPDMRGRVSVGFATSGGNADVAALAMDDAVAVANRRPKHRHTAHSHTQPFTSTGASSPYPNSGDRGSSITYNLSGSSVDGGSGNANDSLDAPAYLVTNYIIKT